jgi:hypothetical protein
MVVPVIVMTVMLVVVMAVPCVLMLTMRVSTGLVRKVCHGDL